MGLGKTIQAIAFYCFLIEMGINGPFLVIAPLSTIPNWLSEFSKFSPQVIFIQFKIIKLIMDTYTFIIILVTHYVIPWFIYSTLYDAFKF